MKTKIFKTGLPIMAFLTAIAFAFATENKGREDSLVTEYIYNNNKCEIVTRNCSNTSNVLCMSGANQVFKWGTTTCDGLLYHP
ncbi:DUF6520 family protein [Moheibacter sp.]|uniref:DUF6520 family protein n=1 Tax=Moheibacter sp. TaxID=1965316 RepID=UPI003C713FC0